MNTGTFHGDDRRDAAAQITVPGYPAAEARSWHGLRVAVGGNIQLISQQR